MLRPIAFRSRFRLSPSLAIVAALLGATACSAPTFEPDNIFALGTGRAMAAGASTQLSVTTPGTADHTTSSNPAVLSVTATSTSEVSVTAGQPGSATLTVYDASNTLLGTTDVEVVATTTIALDTGVPNDVTVLAGETYGLHATTLDARGDDLVGDGAIHFAYQGALTSSGAGDCLFGGDCGSFFFGNAGEGEVVMTAAWSSATTVVTIHAVEALDSFTFAQPSVEVAANGPVVTVAMSMLAAGSPVSTVPRCTAGDTSTVIVLPSLGLSELSTTGEGLGIAGEAAGATTVTCTAGGQTATLAVTVH
jgi:hypothetical protein